MGACLFAIIVKGKAVLPQKCRVILNYNINYRI